MRGHIRRRGQKWVVIVGVGHGEDGRRKQRWHSGYRRRQDAQRALTEITSRLEAGTYVAPSKQTLATFLRSWLDSVKVKVRPSTYSSYRLNLERYVIPRLGSVPLQNLTPAGLNAFYADLLAGGRTTREGGLAPRRLAPPSNESAHVIRALSLQMRTGSQNEAIRILETQSHGLNHKRRQAEYVRPQAAWMQPEPNGASQPDLHEPFIYSYSTGNPEAS